MPVGRWVEVHDSRDIRDGRHHRRREDRKPKGDNKTGDIRRNRHDADKRVDSRWPTHGREDRFAMIHKGPYRSVRGGGLSRDARFEIRRGGRHTGWPTPSPTKRPKAEGGQEDSRQDIQRNTCKLPGPHVMVDTRPEKTAERTKRRKTAQQRRTTKAKRHNNDMKVNTTEPTTRQDPY